MSDPEFYAIAAVIAGAAIYAMTTLNKVDDSIKKHEEKKKEDDPHTADMMANSIDLSDMNTLSSQRSGDPAFNKHVNIRVKPMRDPLKFQRELTKITLAQDRMRHTHQDEAEAGIVLPTHAEQKWYNGSIATDQ